MNPRNPHFTVLISLLLTVAATQYIAAQTSPRLFAEVHVVRSMRQLHGAQMTYQATAGAGHFGSLQNLRQEGFIDDALASGEKYGYLYVVATVDGVPGQTPASFTVTATPRSYRKSGIRSFFINTAGEIRGGDKSGAVATSSDPIIDDCTNGSISDNERCTIQDMRALHSAQMTYAATGGMGNYGTFPQLYQAGLIRSDLSDYTARGYLYEVQIIASVPGQQPASFKIWASPHHYPTLAIRSFYIDQTGVLRGADRNGGQADQNDPPVSK